MKILPEIYLWKFGLASVRYQCALVFHHSLNRAVVHLCAGTLRYTNDIKKNL